MFVLGFHLLVCFLKQKWLQKYGPFLLIGICKLIFDFCLGTGQKSVKSFMG